ncbi:MAG: hypothetical protein WBD47_09170 [Phormidesmis sp.]
MNTSSVQGKPVIDPPASRQQPAQTGSGKLTRERPRFPLAGLLAGPLAGQLLSKLRQAKLPLTQQSLTKLPPAKVAAVLGVLGATTGLAFTQVAPAPMQAALLPDRVIAKAPLRRAGDPATEPFLSTRDLFLTHQIFYRKVEAIARIPGTTPASSESSATASRTSAANADSKNKTAETPTGKPPQTEQVIAAAPPPPKVEQPIFEGTTIDNVLEMRVSLARDVDAIAFATSGGGVITDLDGNVLRSLSAESNS